MSSHSLAVRRAWHPLTGAVLVGLLAVLALATWGTGAGGGAVGLTAFLAMGAIAGYSVSGST